MSYLVARMQICLRRVVQLGYLAARLQINGADGESAADAMLDIVLRVAK